MILHFQSLAYFEITHRSNLLGAVAIKSKKDTKGEQMTSVATMPLVTDRLTLTFICDHNVRTSNWRHHR